MFMDFGTCEHFKSAAESTPETKLNYLHVVPQHLCEPPSIFHSPTGQAPISEAA